MRREHDIRSKERFQEIFYATDKIRTFFREKEFLDVVSPPLVENPGMETHLHPFRVQSMAGHSLPKESYLHTSPEFAMKEVLAEGFEKIFQISYCFRDEPASENHRHQFLMLEWYRRNESLMKIKEDCHQLIQEFHDDPVIIKSHKVDDLFREFCHFSILDLLEPKELRKKIDLDFKKYSQPDLSSFLWEDLYFLLFLNEIEPRFRGLGWIFLEDFPAPLAALSELNPSDSRIASRFELYFGETEIANAFQELTSLEELEKRFEKQSEEKKKTYGYQLPRPERFYRVMENFPSSAGIALGVERFIGSTQSKGPSFWPTW